MTDYVRLSLLHPMTVCSLVIGESRAFSTLSNHAAGNNCRIASPDRTDSAMQRVIIARATRSVCGRLMRDPQYRQGADCPASGGSMLHFLANHGAHGCWKAPVLSSRAPAILDFPRCIAR